MLAAIGSILHFLLAGARLYFVDLSFSLVCYKLDGIDIVGLGLQIRFRLGAIVQILV